MSRWKRVRYHSDSSDSARGETQPELFDKDGGCTDRAISAENTNIHTYMAQNFLMLSAFLREQLADKAFLALEIYQRGAMRNQY